VTIVATHSSTTRVRKATRIEWISLAASLIPFVVAVMRAAVQDWMPVGDAAYFTVRSRDVFSPHLPLLGAWSSGSSVVGVAVNNLGPLQLDLLAPFTRLSPYLGTGVGSAVVNATCIVIVWFVARRILTPVRVAWVMAGTTLFLGTLGLAWLIDARQQFALVIPFFALLWATAGMWAGISSSVPIGLGLGSMIVQTHFTYAYQTVVVTAVGVIGFVLVARLHVDRSRWKRVAVVNLVVLAVCWIQPLLDQFLGTGNLGRVLGPARESQAGTGLNAGIQIVAGGSLVPPFWLPGSIGTFLQPRDGVSIVLAVVAALAWLAASAVVVWFGVRSGGRFVIALGAASATALVAALGASALIPVSSFGLVPQNYYWVWSVGAFLTIALLAGASSVPNVLFAIRPPRLAGRQAVVLPVLAIVLAIAAWPRYPVSSVPRDENEADRFGRALRDQIHKGLRSGEVDDIVEVDLSRAFFGNNYPFVMLVELQRAGIEFRFPPENRNLQRFGESRCAPSGEYQRILLIAGRNPAIKPGSIVLAEVVGITNEELAEYRQLQMHFGEMLRAGDVTVDQDAVVAVLGGSTDKLNDVIDTPGMPAAGLARSLDHWRTWGYAGIPTSERDAFDRWFDFEQRSSADFQTVVLEEPTAISPQNQAPTAAESC